MTKKERAAILRQANKLVAWTKAYWWQLYRNHPEVIELRPMLTDTAAKLRAIASQRSKVSEAP